MHLQYVWWLTPVLEHQYFEEFKHRAYFVNLMSYQCLCHYLLSPLTCLTVSACHCLMFAPVFLKINFWCRPDGYYGSFNANDFNSEQVKHLRPWQHILLYHNHDRSVLVLAFEPGNNDLYFSFFNFCVSSRYIGTISISNKLLHVCTSVWHGLRGPKHLPN